MPVSLVTVPVGKKHHWRGLEKKEWRIRFLEATTWAKETGWRHTLQKDRGGGEGAKNIKMKAKRKPTAGEQWVIRRTWRVCLFCSPKSRIPAK